MGVNRGRSVINIPVSPGPCQLDTRVHGQIRQQRRKECIFHITYQSVLHVSVHASGDFGLQAALGLFVQVELTTYNHYPTQVDFYILVE